MPPLDDSRLVRIVDAASVEAARRSGAWLQCCPGCTQCCFGPFAINVLDALRMRRGYDQITQDDPARAARLKSRSLAWIARNVDAFPGDRDTGVLAEADPDFGGCGEDDACPALDPDTGLCELYESRPMTCRTFGPPARTADGAIGVCELCFDGATDDQIAACLVDSDAGAVEAELLERAGDRRQTVVAYCLAR
ncbi:MAG: YkgJ family cysteine cluster protein [Acidobacteria bacterium]|nr:YkgJ family cysteine cluster protein [Acidobacteriota bacterium]